MPPRPKFEVRFDAPPPIILWARKHAAKLVKNISQTTRLRIRARVVKSLEDGETVRELRRALLAELGDSKRALTIARTETMRASNKGRQLEWERQVEEGELPPNLQRVWLFAELEMKNGELCPICQSMADQKRDLDEPFEDLNGTQYDGPPAHPNCILPGQDVQGAVTAGLRAFYSGPAVELQTQQGHVLRLTVNHPVLTNRGWVIAQDLVQGDKVLSQDRNVELGRVFPGLNDQHHGPTVVEQVFQTLMANGRTSVQPRELDLHGDARWVDGNIDIVHVDGRLADDVETLCSKHRSELGLIRSLVQQPLLAGERSSEFRFAGVGLATAPTPRTSTLSSDFTTSLDAHPLDALLLGLAAYWDVQRSDPSLQNATADATFALELQERSAGLIAFDEIVQVRNFEFSGHVYDFESKYGWILAQNIVISNCRCTTGLVEGRRRGVRAAVGNGNNQYKRDNPTKGASVSETEWRTWAYESHNINEALSGARSGLSSQGEPLGPQDMTRLKRLGERIQHAAESTVIDHPVLFRGESYRDEKSAAQAFAGKRQLDSLTSVTTEQDIAEDYAFGTEGVDDNKARVLIRFTSKTGQHLGVQTAPLGPSAEAILPKGAVYRFSAPKPLTVGQIGRFTHVVDAYSTATLPSDAPRVQLRGAIGNGNNQYKRDNPTKGERSAFADAKVSGDHAGWRRKNQDRYKNDPEFRAAVDAITLLTQGSTDAIRAASLAAVGKEKLIGRAYHREILDKPLGEAASKMATYKNYFKGQKVETADHATLREAGVALNKAIDEAPELDVPIFRGVRVSKIYYPPGEVVKYKPAKEFTSLENLKPGDDFPIPGVASFTTDAWIARQFSRGEAKGQGGRSGGRPDPTVANLVLEVQGARGIPVSALSPWRQSEVLTRGDFTVKSVERNQDAFHVVLTPKKGKR